MVKKTSSSKSKMGYMTHDASFFIMLGVVMLGVIGFNTFMGSSTVEPMGPRKNNNIEQITNTKIEGMGHDKKKGMGNNKKKEGMITRQIKNTIP